MSNSKRFLKSLGATIKLVLEDGPDQHLTEAGT